MAPRRFAAGQTFYMSGVDFRVRPGRKGVDDLVLDWLTPRGWVPIGMDTLALKAAFFYENEDLLYPRVRGFEGGEYVLRHVEYAVRHGHADAIQRLEHEKRAKRQRGAA